MKTSELVEMYNEARAAANRSEGDTKEYLNSVANRLADIIVRNL